MKFTKTRVHKLLERGEVIIFPGVYDAIGAKIAAQVGFDLLFISGYSMAATQLGLPDFGYLTQTEMVQVVRRICKAVKRPIIVDADTGYGNPLNVIRTVDEFIDAGAAGMFLEDQVWPKRCGHMRGKKVISMEEHVQKIRAAVDARKGRDFFIVARTDARQISGLKEAIRRCKAYKKAGADALFIEAPQSVEELAQIGRELEPPLVANMLEGGVTPLQSREELKRLGFHLVVYPLTCLYANAWTMTEVLTHLKKVGTTKDILSQLHTFKHFHDLIDLDAHYALDEKYSVETD